MRWSTLVSSVTLFYSLSLVNAIPHDTDEKRHWLHQRQALSSSLSTSVLPSSLSEESRGGSSLIASPTPSPDTTTLPLVSSSSSFSTSRSPSSTTQPSPETSSTIPSSSSSISSSSSSSLSSSSTVSTTSSSSSPTITDSPDTQGSTSYRRFSSTRELPSDTLTSEGNVQTSTGSGSSFLKNKAAMGSTFAIVGLIGVAIIIGAIFFLIKKVRKRRDEDELDTYFEKFPADNNNNNASNRNPGGNDYGLGPSATDLTSPANDQAYMSRDVHYGATSQYPNQYANYNGFEYPPERGSVIERPVSYAPGTAYAAAMSQRGQYHYEGQVEDPNTVPNHPFADADTRRY